MQDVPCSTPSTAQNHQGQKYACGQCPLSICLGSCNGEIWILSESTRGWEGEERKLSPEFFLWSEKAWRSHPARVGGSPPEGTLLELLALPQGLDLYT